VGTLAVFAIGYVIGARTGRKEWDDLAKSLKALWASEEFGDVVIAARSHLSHTLRELAEMLDRRDTPDIEDQDLVAHVRTLLGGN
jgi:hypothetical protein